MTNIPKSGDHAPKIMGTKPSLHSGQTLISSGIPSLDHIIDGGIPLGSLVIIEEDQFCDYAQLVLSYFMSEAVCNRHPLLAASLDTNPARMTEELPAPADPEAAVVPPAAAAGGEGQQMTIAWRYQGLPQHQAPTAGRFGQHYDLSRYIEKSVIDSMDISVWPENGHLGDVSPSDPVTSLLAACDRLAGRPDPASGPTVCRLAVRSLGSPLWCAAPDRVVRACHLLRALLRRTAAVALVTVPTHLWTDEAAVSRLRRCADICLGLESFQGTPAATNPAYSDYHGLLHLQRLSARNVLAARYPRHPDLAFKVRRKKFAVETLHLPPELSETVSRSQEEDGPSRTGRTGASCQAARPGAALDF